MAAVSQFLEFTPPPRPNKTKGHPEDETPLVLVLAPFNPPAKIFFEETKLTETRTKSVIIRNPGAVPLHIILDKLPEPDAGLILSESIFTVPACAQETLILTWQPVKSDGFRHVVHVKDAKKNKKISEIIVTGTCVSPIKKKGRVGKKLASLRTKVLSNRVVVTSPKIAAPRQRMPLRNKEQINAVSNENTFLVAEKRPRTAEDKENAPSPKKKPAKQSAGCRQTFLGPPPTFDSHRKRKAPVMEGPLEVAMCLKEQEPQQEPSRRPMRRSTYSLDSPGSNSLLTVAQASEQRSNSPQQYQHIISQPAQLLENRKDRISIDSLEIGTSIISDDVFSFRDSLDSNPDANRSIDRDSLDAVVAPSACDRSLRSRNRSVTGDTSKSNIVSPTYADFTILAAKGKSLENSINSKDLDFTRKNSTSIETSEPCAKSSPLLSRADRLSIESSHERWVSPGNKGFSALPPLQFSPSFDMKRCTYVMPPKEIETKVHNLSYTIIDESNEELSDLHLKTPVLSTPMQRKGEDVMITLQQPAEINSSSPMHGYNLRESEGKTPDKKGVLDKSRDHFFETLEVCSPDNFKLKTPQLNTPVSARIQELEAKTVFDSDIKVRKSLQNSLKTPQLRTPCSGRKKWSANFNKEPIKTPGTPEWVKVYTDVTVSQNCSGPSTENLDALSPSAFKLNTPQIETPRSKKASESTSTGSHLTLKTPQLRTPRSNRKSLVKEIVDNFSLYELQESPFSSSKSLLSKVKTQEKPAILEISPPKKSKMDPQLSDEPKKQQCYPTRVVAKSITARQVMSPTTRLKRLVAAHKSATPKAKIAEPKPAPSKRPSQQLKPAAKPAQRYTGVPMATLKLKPQGRKAEQGQSQATKDTVFKKPVEKNLNSAPRLTRSATLSSLKKPMKTPPENLKNKKELEQKMTRSVSASSMKNSANKMQAANEKISRSASTSSLRTPSDQTPSKKLMGEQQPQLGSSASLKKAYLSNPDQYLKSLSQPADYLFLYAATSKVDPFLTNSLYYDPEWLDRQEADLIKWLNSLLTPPAELDSDSGGHWRVDVAALWKKSQSQKLELAPSKEAVSSRYLTNTRLDVVRKAATTLFRTDMAVVLSKLAVSINKKLLRIRDDRDLHLDYGLQCKVLSLLLCYNPLWLRIGLETIFGCRIALVSNSDIVGLTAFIRKRLLTDAYLRKKHSHPLLPSSFLPSFGDEMKKFIMQKFLMLVYFLDQAKMQKLVGHDPCLFVTNSPFKESSDLVKEFAKDLISGLGDITKYLKSFGYVLQHKQTYLDEFNYAVVDRQDLRDGVRLTRVMEIILGNHGLSAKVRTPAISRLQKVHNVDVALKALKGAGYEIQGDITSKDIVDGHREKTLSLLWQIIYKFQAPRYEKAARKLQNWWRSNSLRFTIQRRIRAKRLAKQNAAASKIQALWRGVSLRIKFPTIRKQLIQERVERTKAAVVIQKHWRRYFLQRAYQQKLEVLRKKRDTAAVVVQKHWRRYVVQNKFRELIRIERERRHEAAVVLQKHWRRHLAEKQYQKLLQIEWEKKNKAAVVLQKHWKRYVAQRGYHEKLVALQELRRIAAEQEKKNIAAVTLQKHWKRYIAQKKYQEQLTALRRKKAAIVLQKHCRRYIAQKRYQKLLAENLRRKNDAAIVLQKHWRRYEARKSYLKLLSSIKEKRNQAAIVLQKHWRRHVAQKSYQKLLSEHLKRRNDAATVIQKHWRKCVARKRYLVLLTAIKKRRNEAAILLQKHWRRFAAQKSYQQMLAAELARRQNIAATTLQKHWKRFAAQRSYQKQLAALNERKNEAATTLQKHWRRFVIQKRYWRLLAEEREKKRNNAAIILQKHWKRYVAQKRYQAQLLIIFNARNAAAVIIQKNWRRYTAQRSYKQQIAVFRALRNKSAIIIQKHWRRYLAQTRYQRQLAEIHATRSAAATVLQKHWRRFIARKDFIQCRTAVRKIQKWWRKIFVPRERRMFLQERAAAIVIQRHVRATIAAKKARQEYIRLKGATIMIQSRFRANCAAKNDRLKYQNLRMAVIVVQNRWRANQKAKKCQLQYQKLKNSVLLIQRRYRAKKLAQTEHARFSALRIATVCVQRHYRAKKLAEQDRRNYLELKYAASIIQAKFRANRMMKAEKAAYTQLKAAAVIFQVQFRAQVAMRKVRREYVSLKNAALILQTRFRAKKAAKIQRSRYLALRNAAIITQRIFRANRAAKSTRSNYLKLKTSTVHIQRLFRANQLMRKARLEFLRKKAATIIIQRHFRSYLVMVACRTRFLELKSAAVAIQQRYRAKKSAQIARKEFCQQRKAAVIIQQHWRALLKVRAERNEYLQLRATVVWVQQKWRGKKLVAIAQREYRLMVAQKEQILAEKRERERSHQAATKIQALWRGHCARKQVKLPKLSTEESLQLHNNVNMVAQKKQTLKTRFDGAISEVFSNETDLHGLIVSFINLDTVTCLSPKLCDELVDGQLVQVVIFYLQSANRSQPYQELSIVCIRTLMNLTRYHNTAPSVWQEFLSCNGLDVLLNIFRAYYEKNAELFCHAVTLLWLFAQDPDKAAVLLSNDKLVKTLKYVYGPLQKKSMKEPKGKSQRKERPLKTADWGLTTAPKAFIHPFTALSSVCLKLGVKI
ncbi:unnamed protein product [Bemisia tabaci]|uniref:Calponin-homology (CH) domain-containing protein n=1 Tax=Bemisia tabaci TaxID=7038 RepID=A0A9P0G582_BEMTA|nr:unnamed protein product [Bemisia tabaci]